MPPLPPLLLLLLFFFFFFGCRRRDETVLTSSLRHHVATRHALTQPLSHAFSLSFALCCLGSALHSLAEPLSRKLSLHIFIHKAPQLRCRVYQLRLATCARARALSISLSLCCCSCFCADDDDWSEITSKKNKHDIKCATFLCDRRVGLASRRVAAENCSSSNSSISRFCTAVVVVVGRWFS